jgi:TRAP transporter 4TM/12TM fusion protein
MKTGGGVLERVFGIALALFVLAEVNYPHLTPQSQLAIFAGLGLVMVFLRVPLHPRLAQNTVARWVDRGFALLTALSCLYIVVQTEPLFERWWVGGQALGTRAGQEGALDVAVGVAGLLLVIEATRRTIGWALPLLVLAFVAYAYSGPYLPDWLLAHRGYSVERIVAQTFLHSQGVFGLALRVMFTYVTLFVLFGAFLQATGGTEFILAFARKVFRKSSGGAAKVAVLSSGLMGSLSGSAVANTATTGTFTIPMMRSSGFKRETAAGVEAAASSGGALVPPVMGAGAYMMLEIVEPAVTYLEIIQAALIPALLYYLSLFLIVHFQARKVGAQSSLEEAGEESAETQIRTPWRGVVFATGFAALILFLLLGYTPFRAVTLALGVILVVSALHPRTRLTLARIFEALARAARDSLPLISAAACVGIILGVVTLTGVGTRLPAAILPLAQESLLLALVAIMVCSIILGMGLPSAVCYLLLATLIGPVLGKLGVVPLAAHLFIFYFGMMSMVTPPVALAAYTAASIAGSPIMKTGVEAFRFALVGFTLPYMFVLRPELLMLAPGGGSASIASIAVAVTVAALGIVAFAAGIAGYLFGRVTGLQRGQLFAAALLLLLPGPWVAVAGLHVPVMDVAGLALLVAGAVHNRRTALASRSA